MVSATSASTAPCAAETSSGVHASGLRFVREPREALEHVREQRVPRQRREAEEGLSSGQLHPSVSPCYCTVSVTDPAFTRVPDAPETPML